MASAARWIAAIGISLCPALVHADAQTAWNAYCKHDYPRALNELRPLAARNDPVAQYYLASIYLDGSAVPRSAIKAAELLGQSATAGYGPAQFTLGVLLYNGSTAGEDRLPPDPARAMPWLLKAAEAGNLMANSLVGQVYWEGRILPRNLERAKQHLSFAANAGVVSAQAALGAMLGSEPGVHSAMESYKWLLLASFAKYPGAAENLEIVANRLNAAEIRDAQLLATMFKSPSTAPN